MTLEAGARLGPYQLQAPLGAGGMGEVYAAVDTRLDRTVAIKVLPPELASDPERRERFEREARTISRLNHPHICTLYDVGNQGGIDFLVMEHLEGETLQDRLSKGALPLEQALRYAIEIADALDKAHGQGIVHRDLKPGNIMLTEEGTKLLDFGLAKLNAPVTVTGGSAETASAHLTGAGTIVGTLPYMAPEQLQGKEANARTDLFALGAIVYEMVAGQRAFEAKDQASLIAAIIERDPPPLADRAAGAPAAFERLVCKCLAKDPNQRWHAAANVADALRWIHEEQNPQNTMVSRPPAWRWRWALAGLCVIVAAAGFLAWLRVQSTPAPLMRTTRLTSYPGHEGYPALSPDGQLVAFTWRGPAGTGPMKLYVKQVDGGDPQLVHTAFGDIHTPTWSPDGQEIAFIGHVDAPPGEPADGVFVAPALGGAARQLRTFRDHGLSWSPDGTQLATSHRENAGGPRSIYLLSVETGQAEKLTSPPPDFSEGDRHPQFSPDGLSLAFVRASESAASEIYRIPLVAGRPQLVTSGAYIRGLAWSSDGRSLVFPAERGDQAGSRLWSVPAAGGVPELLSVGEEGYRPSLSRRGHRLAYERLTRRLGIVRLDTLSAPDGDKVAVPFSASTARQWAPRYSPDGQMVAFSSFRSGHAELWVSDANGGNARQVTTLETPLTTRSAWSPDGQQLVFSAPKAGNLDVFIVNVRSGFARQLTRTEGIDEDPHAWSTDGRWIYFSARQAGRRELFRMPAEGGDPIRLTVSGGGEVVESADRRHLYFTKTGPADSPAAGPAGLWRMPVDGGAETLVLEDVRPGRFDVTDQGIYYLNMLSDPREIEFFDFATGQTSAVAAPEDSPTFQGFSVSPNGRWILYVTNSFESDIMLVENYR